MMTVHYLHRLPADYDLPGIRQRATGRGPIWDTAPDLYFKAFLVREAGRHGAIENSYSSFYLWRSDQGFIDFLLNDRYLNVTSTFGRAEIANHVALDARRGQGKYARFAFEQTVEIHRDQDLGQAFARETDHNRASAESPGVVAAVSAVDTAKWRFSRFLLSEDTALKPHEDALTYEVVHLSQPLLHTLKNGASS